MKYADPTRRSEATFRTKSTSLDSAQQLNEASGGEECSFESLNSDCADLTPGASDPNPVAAPRHSGSHVRRDASGSHTREDERAESRILTAYASEPPPADLTRTYDDAELNQLLTKAAQSRLDQAVPELDRGAQREANTSSNSAPTVRPPTATSGSFVTRVKGDDTQPMAPLRHDNTVDSSDDDLTQTFESRSFSNPLPTVVARSDLSTEPCAQAQFGSDFAAGGGPFGPAPHTAPGNDRRGSHSSRGTKPATIALAVLLVLGMGLGLVVVLSSQLHLGGLASPRANSVDKELTPGLRGGSTGRVFIDIAVEPPGSTLRLDGQPASNPLRLAYPMDGALHKIVGSAPGLKEKSLELRFDRDISVVIVLSP